jgi:DNA-binding PadR family transcriptional regulator
MTQPSSRLAAMPTSDPNSRLPLSPPVFSILLTLGSKAMHGYAIMQELERRTDGRETLLPGSLYATIARMVADQLIEEVSAPDESTDRRRRFYRATGFGRSVARAEAHRLAGLVKLAREQRLLGDEA